MMRIVLAAVARKPPSWVREGFDEYRKRMPAALQLDYVEVRPLVRDGSDTAASAKRKEAERLQAVIGARSRLVALDEHGTAWTTVDLAALLQGWMGVGRDLTLAVGGADGLDDSLLKSADAVWSLSPLTLPHAFVPVIVAEQLYRAWSLLNNHPYHRA
jgi:23S rRNA (pseudouridine1915-N3)-methyltransferase